MMAAVDIILAWILVCIFITIFLVLVGFSVWVISCKISEHRKLQPRKKKAYLITYEGVCNDRYDVIYARSAEKAIKKFKKQWFYCPSILGIEERDTE